MRAAWSSIQDLPRCSYFCRFFLENACREETLNLTFSFVAFLASLVCSVLAYLTIYSAVICSAQTEREQRIWVCYVSFHQCVQVDCSWCLLQFVGAGLRQLGSSPKLGGSFYICSWLEYLAWWFTLQEKASAHVWFFLRLIFGRIAYMDINIFFNILFSIESAVCSLCF